MGYLLIWLGLWAASIAAAIPLAYRAGRERARYDARIDAAERKIEINRGRHAASWPRYSPTARQAVALPQLPAAPRPSQPRPRSTPQPSRWPAPPPWSPGRVVTTAADIAPVIIPRPGARIPLRPQPGRDSGDGTAAIPRVRDTGEMRALTDTYIAQLEQREAAWRRQEFAS